MRLLKTLFLAASLFISATACAQLQEGVNYRTLTMPGQADSGEKIEVMEVFGYFCPHCYKLDPTLEAWVRKMGDRIVFKRVHTAFFGKVLQQQRMYFAFEALGRAEDLHRKILDAVHLERRPLNDELGIVEFAVRNGVDKQKFLDTYNSFSVVAKAQRVAQMETAYKLDGVPNLIIDGRFVTGLGIVAGALAPNTPEPASHAYLLQVAEALVNKVQAERGRK